MQTEKRLCGYRNCKKIVPITAHGNNHYCPSEGDYKLSCQYQEKLLRELENSKKRKLKEQMKGILATLLNGRQRKQIAFNRFQEYILPHLGLFRADVLRETHFYKLDQYKLYKVQVGEEFFVTIEQESNELQIIIGDKCL
jgi:hypothetical protein